MGCRKIALRLQLGGARLQIRVTLRPKGLWEQYTPKAKGCRRVVLSPFHGGSKAAKQGDVEAQIHLAYAYVNGDGAPKDVQAAIMWWREAAARGNAVAQHSLGVAYFNGKRCSDRTFRA
ncbi:tetratricopeptide repeat protein [Pseudaminobacter soli (ex Li et al. 2025)]|uniref:tetratricopeptide repeat protein n=1 Tax=Pseudaminobacter soli (ex Li et al. 2025) TaxID=1295366 RepID=UPI003CD0218F